MRSALPRLAVLFVLSGCAAAPDPNKEFPDNPHDAAVPTDGFVTDGNPDQSVPPDMAMAVSTILAPAAPMGWNTWYGFKCTYDETKLRSVADAMVSTGLLAAGYQYLIVDDCWQGSRDGSGNIVADATKFPSGMKAFVDYVHSKGLKAGIYTDVGTMTCQGLPGSLGHEMQDAATYASWGIDFIKEDWCNTTGLDAKAQYTIMHNAIVATGRPMILNTCNWGQQSPWEWAPQLAQTWRTTGDIADNWTAIMTNLDGNSPHAAVAGPGHFNDPDYLQIGLGGLDDVSYKSQFALWSVMAAPLTLSPNVGTMSATHLAIVKNPEIIAVNQDSAGFQGYVVTASGNSTIWSKPLATPGQRAVVLFNRDDTNMATISFTWADLGLADGTWAVRDLWTQQDVGSSPTGYSANVPPHGNVFLKVTGQEVTAQHGTIWLESARLIYGANGWHQLQRGKSLVGNTLTLGGTTYQHGIGTNAESRIMTVLGGTCTAFDATVGVDDEVGSMGSVVFQVWADGTKLYDSGTLTGAYPSASVHVDVTGKQMLDLRVTGAGDNIDYDHGDWADAKLTCAP